jgi:hypothetical protein
VILIHIPDQAPVGGRQPFGTDVVTEPMLNFQRGSWPEIALDLLCQSLAHTGADIFAGNDQILAAIIDAAQHDMRVGVAGIAMINRDPIELGPKVTFHLCHQPAREGLEVFILIAVFGRDDEAELVTILLPAFKKLFTVSDVLVGTVKLSRLTVASHPVALDVTKMGGGIRALARELDDPRFDDAAPCLQPRQTVSASQYPSHACPASDPAAVETGLSNAFVPARERNRRQYATEIFLAALRSARSDFPKAGFELIVAHAGSLRQSDGTAYTVDTRNRLRPSLRCDLHSK